MADEGPDETKLAERINRHRTGVRPERPAPNGRKQEPGSPARRPLRDRRVRPESGGREPERDY